MKQTSWLTVWPDPMRPLGNLYQVTIQSMSRGQRDPVAVLGLHSLRF